MTDVHHIVWASKQGPTVLSNLLTLCIGHHSRVHELGWKMDGDANGSGPLHQPAGKGVRLFALTDLAPAAAEMSA